MEEEESSVNFIMLADGSVIAYEEKGVEKRMAKWSLLVLHGVPSSHIAGMLGVSEDLLKEMGVRLVSINRPGYSLLVTSTRSKHTSLQLETLHKLQML
jgi:hypothetical protein